MRRSSYIRWHRFNNHYYYTMWKSQDLIRRRKRSYKAHARVMRNIKHRYAKEYRRHLRILRVLSTNCFKRLAPQIKKWRRKKHSWKTVTSVKWMVSHIKLPTITKTVYSKELSSVDDYAQTIKNHVKEFSAFDQKLINRCNKFF